MATCLNLSLRTVYKVGNGRKSLCLLPEAKEDYIKSFELPRPIPWNQTSDIHRGSTDVTYQDADVTETMPIQLQVQLQRPKRLHHSTSCYK